MNPTGSIHPVDGIGINLYLCTDLLAPNKCHPWVCDLNCGWPWIWSKLHDTETKFDSDSDYDFNCCEYGDFGDYHNNDSSSNEAASALIYPWKWQTEHRSNDRNCYHVSQNMPKAIVSVYIHEINRFTKCRHVRIINNTITVLFCFVNLMKQLCSCSGFGFKMTSVCTTFIL